MKRFEFLTPQRDALTSRRRPWLLSMAGAGLLLVALVFTTALVRPSMLAPTQQTEIQADIDQIEQRTASLRQLPRLEPIQRGFLPRDQLRDYFESDLLTLNTPEEIEANVVRWEVLGYVPPGLDVINTFLDVLGEQVAGFYDAQRRTLYIVGDEKELRPSDVVTMAHEMTHALQDQHYDIRQGFEQRRNENDQQLAYQALIEGDATLSMVLYAQRYLTQREFQQVVSESGPGGTSALDAAPRIIQRELMFPYIDGLALLTNQYLRGSWTAVDRLWQNPPRSTEQVLHPEKYQAGEGPIELPMPDLASLLGPEWRLLEETTLGELDWRVLVEQYVDETTADAVGSGWGGDRFQLFKRDRDGAVLLAARTAWDTPADAREFFDAYPQVAAGRHGAALESVFPPDLSGLRFWSGRAGSWDHELIGGTSQVNLIITTDPSAIASIATALRPE